MSAFKHIFWRLVSLSGANTCYRALHQNGQILCLGYHSVSDPSTNSTVRAEAYRHLSTPKNLFANEIAYLKTHRYTFLTLGDLIHIKRREQPIPPRSVMIYFDDGYRDIYFIAYLILKKRMGKEDGEP